ncbi:NAD-dependent epimerase/dehydratase [Meredithblackwellia eburnea MCA 4105]
MQIFLTGATGWVGRHVAQKLKAGGHSVHGLARSPASAQALTKVGVTPVLGGLEDLEVIKKAAAESDGVIHCGFVHDFSRFAEVCAIDRAVITAIGETLKGSNKPFIVTSGTAVPTGPKDATLTETDRPATGFNPRYEAELLACGFKDQKVRSMVIRLPTVYGDDDEHGFVAGLVGAAKTNKRSIFVGDGANRWPAAHVVDVASLYVLALEKGVAGEVYHAVLDTGVPTKDIARAIGEGAGVPTVSLEAGSPDVSAHLGFLEMFFVGLDNPTSSALTKKELGWEPKEKTLLNILKKDGPYFA